MCHLIPEGIAIIHPLVAEHVRENAHQSFLNGLGIAFVVMMTLTLAGTTLKPESDLPPVTIVLRATVAAITALTLGVAVLFLTINGASQVRERTRQFAILRMLGGSLSYIINLLLQETVLVAAPGTIAGIVFADLEEWLISSIFPNIFVLRTPYEVWVLAVMISAGSFFVAGVFTAWKAKQARFGSKPWQPKIDMAGLVAAGTGRVRRASWSPRGLSRQSGVFVLF